MNLILTGTIVLGINNRFKEFFKWFTSYDLLWRGYMAIIQGLFLGRILEFIHTLLPFALQEG
jgi:hypothetical protein